MTKFISIVIVTLIWELLTYLNFFDKTFFPPPFKILSNLDQLIFYENFLTDICHSMSRLFIALVIALPIALLLSLACAHKKFFDHIVNPIVAITFPLPKVALFPLLLLIFGIDNYSKIALISIGMFYLLFINFRIGFLRIINSSYSDIVKIYPISNAQYFISFLIRGAIQELLTGLQIAVNYGLTLVVVSEISVSNNGIGHFIWKSWDQFNIINVYSAVLSLGFIGFVFYNIFSLLIDKLRRTI